jgi:hypothetical protein
LSHELPFSENNPTIRDRPIQRINFQSNLCRTDILDQFTLCKARTIPSSQRWIPKWVSNYSISESPSHPKFVSPTSECVIGVSPNPYFDRVLILNCHYMGSVFRSSAPLKGESNNDPRDPWDSETDLRLSDSIPRMPRSTHNSTHSAVHGDIPTWRTFLWLILSQKSWYCLSTIPLLKLRLRHWIDEIVHLLPIGELWNRRSIHSPNPHRFRQLLISQISPVCRSWMSVWIEKNYIWSNRIRSHRRSTDLRDESFCIDQKPNCFPAAIHGKTWQSKAISSTDVSIAL